MRHRQIVSLLDGDAELAEAIPVPERQEARRRAAVRVLELDGPRWDPSTISQTADAGWLGLFVLRGLLIRRVSVASRTACEIFAAGDLLRPWDEDGEYDPLAITLDWLVLAPTQLAVLDDGLALRMTRWPSVTAKLTQRVASRARHLAVIAAVTHLPRTHARLLLMFWLLADRWGAVTPEGVVVKLPLTHQVLSMLVGSHRPTVTIALQRLTRDGLVIRQAPNRWLFTHKAIRLLDDRDGLAAIGMQHTAEGRAAPA